MKIIAFCGLTQSGKDTAAEALLDVGYFKSGFATKLKEVIADIYQIPIEWMLDTELKNTPCKELWGKTPRQILQPIATEGFRDLGHQDTWVNYLYNRLVIQEKYETPDDQVCICIVDVRFPNEAKMLKAIGATIVYIKNPNDKAGIHASESQVEAVAQEYADYTIVNDKNTTSIEQLHEQVIKIAQNVQPVYVVNYNPFKNVVARSIHDKQEVLNASS